MARLNRRQFLSAAALGTAGAALESRAKLLGSSEKPWNATTGRALHKFRDPVPTVCMGCSAGCAILAFRDGDRVVQVGPNPEAAPFSALCARAYESLEALYDPERVLRPLRRKGKRGEGRWEEISWGEALDQLGKVLQEAPGASYVDVGRPDPLAGSILQALGVTQWIDDAASREWAGRQAQKAVYGAPLGRPDLSRARTILLLGARPLDEGPHYSLLARDLIAARSRGASIVAVDSYAGVTGSLATEWLPCRPGTEALVALALVRVALSEGWLDPAAFSRLVSSPMGNLSEALLPYKLELVEAAAGIPVLTLVRLARRLATEGPSLCLADGAGTRQAASLEASAAILNCLAGGPEAAGARLAHRPDFVPTVEPTSPRAKVMKDILAGNERASLYLAYRSNPLYRVPRSESVRRAFGDADRVGLLVAMDTQLTETAQMADLVLPAAADLELWNLVGGYTPEGKPYALLQQPTTQRPAETTFLRQPGVPLEKVFEGPQRGPKADARQLGDALLETLTILQHPARQRFPYADCGAYVRKLADSLPAGEGAAGYQGLAAGGAWVGKSVTYPWASARGYPTSSKKLDVGGKLAHEVPAQLARLEGDSFALVVLRQPELSSGYSNTRWGREIRFENPVLMNAGAARKMGLARGDRVVVRTSVSETTATVVPIEGIHPQAVALAEDFGHWAGGVAATAKAEATGEKPKALLTRRNNALCDPVGLTTQRVEPGEVPWWAHYGTGISVWGISPFTSDELGAQAWREIRVSVRRA